MKHVSNGEAEVRVVEFPVPGIESEKPVVEGVASEVIPPKMRRVVLNEPAEIVLEKLNLKKLRSVEGMKVKGAGTIVGPFIYPVKGTRGSVAKIKVQAGMWEVRRGVKVDGGERRKVQVRRKRLLDERKKTRK